MTDDEMISIYADQLSKYLKDKRVVPVVVMAEAIGTNEPEWAAISNPLLSDELKRMGVHSAVKYIQDLQEAFMVFTDKVLADSFTNKNIN